MEKLGAFGEDMSPVEFRERFVRYVLGNGFSGWALIANSPKGHMPIGLALGETRRKLLMLGEIIWFPWASVRNKLEAALTFFNGLRDEMVVMEWAPHSERKSWEHICRYGIMRRVGTVYGMGNEAVAVFQTKARQ